MHGVLYQQNIYSVTAVKVLNPAKPMLNRGADKSLAPSGRKQATATEDFEFHISYL